MSMDAEASGGFTESARRYATGCLQSIERTFRPNLPLYAAAGFFLLVTFAIAAIYHIPLTLDASRAFLENIPIFVLIVIGALSARRLVRDDPPREAREPAFGDGRDGWPSASPPAIARATYSTRSSPSRR